jgi:hypothetical protein
MVQTEVRFVHCSSQNHRFYQGGLLALESISKSAMVIMSYQRLFIDFLASFCHFFGLPYHFLYPKKHLE